MLALCCVATLALATPAAAAAGPVFTGATWLHHRWLQGADAKELDRLATRLGELGVGIVFPNVAHGSAEPIPGMDGRVGWVPRPDHGRAFVDGLRARLPGVRVIPYKGYTGCGWLADPARRAVQVDAMIATVEALDADGFQLDMECTTIDSRDGEALDALLAEIAAALGPDRTFSVAIPILTQRREDFAQPADAEAPWLEPLASQENPRSFSRQPHVYESVFRHADQVAVMLYDTWYLWKQVDQYVQLVAGQTWAAAGYAARHDTPEFLPGIRFSVHEESKPDGGVYHRHEVENPVTAWEGIASVLDQPVADGVLVRDRLTGLAAFRLDLELAPGQPSEIGRGYLEGLRDALSEGGAVAIPVLEKPTPAKLSPGNSLPDPLAQ